MSKRYKIRSFQNGANKKGQPFVNYSLTLPREIAERVPADVAFTCEFTEEGVLYRYVGESAPSPVPAWARPAMSLDVLARDQAIRDMTEVEAEEQAMGRLSEFGSWVA